MLELRQISKYFNKGTPSEMVAIDNLNLAIKPGDFVTVIGGNGAGKSTLCNVISGTIEPDSGCILLNGVDMTYKSEYSRAPYFGRVFQDPMSGTCADMSILENLTIAYGRGTRRSLFKWFNQKKDKPYFIELLKSLGLGLENRLNDKVGLLSGGQRQALTLLMATMRKRPSERIIKRDYVRFALKDKEEAKQEVNDAFKKAKDEYRTSLNKLKEENLSKNERKQKIAELRQEYDKQISKYDLTKQILLLDEHTAALDPKTAQKVLELTEKIVKENNLTTIMITHNMKDAIRYGNRLIMLSRGQVVVDYSGKEKSKLSVEDLLAMFHSASQDDCISDSAILG